MDFVIIIPFAYSSVHPSTPPGLDGGDAHHGHANDRRPAHLQRRHHLPEEQVGINGRDDDVEGVENVADRTGATSPVEFQFLTAVEGSHSVQVGQDADADGSGEG